MRLMTGVATRRPWNQLPVVIVEAPLPVVFHVGLKSHELCTLSMPPFVDGNGAVRAANLEHHDGLIRPSTCRQKAVIRSRIYEDVVEDVMVGRPSGGIVGHVDSGGQINPVAIMYRRDEIAPTGVGRGIIRWSRRALRSGH